MGTYKYVDIDDIILQGLEFKKICNVFMIKNKKFLSIEKDFVKNGYYIFDTNERV